MKRLPAQLPSLALAAVVAGVACVALLHLPSGTPGPLAFLIIAGFAAIYGFLNYFIPYLLMAYRLRRLSSSRFESVQASFLGDLARLHGECPARKRWALALLPYPDLVVRLTVRRHAALSLPSEVVGWFGADAYEVFHVLTHEGTSHTALMSASRLMKAGHTDYPTFYGYCESAGVEAALLAIEQNLPIEYARELLPDR